MRIHRCSGLLALSLVFGGAARGQVVILEGEVGLASKDFGDKAVVRVRANSVLRAEPGSTVELKARRFVFEGPVTLDARGAPGEAGQAAPDSTDTRVHVDEVAAPSWTPISPSCALSELDRGAPGLPGGPGTPGAIVTFMAQDVDGREYVTSLVAGGKGGAGGPGGKGRMVRCLTALAPDAGAPELGAPELAVLLGPTGPDGPPGQDGADGQVLFNEAPDPGASPVSFALTISGGISLGNYEAGYNWALMRQLKKRAAAARTRKDPPRLDVVAVTGASAGSINTFLSAIAWCQTAEEDAKESATRNIFHDTWVPIGLPQLIPANGVYSKTDALLSTAAFASVRDTMASRAAQRVFREGCVLPIGMTVTRSEPEIIHGESLEAPMDRFAVALEARTVDGTLKFYDSRPEHESSYVRPYLHFRNPAASGADAEAPVAMGDVMKALTASTSFPIAFGQQHISYYAASPTDPSKLTARTDWFWDGGVFDNIPVGLALSFVEKPLFGRTRPAGRFQLFAIDPERRRQVGPLSESPSAEPPAPRKGLGNLEKILGNYWSVSRKYELQSFIRFALPRLTQACQSAEGDKPLATGFGSCSGHPMVSSRFVPVFGERLGTFGAFVLQAFREFDFAAGIYDALYAFAQRECEWQQQLYEDEPGEASMSQCVVRKVHAGYEELHLGERDSALAGYVVKRLLREELAQRRGRERAEQILKSIKLGDQSAAEWVAAAPQGVPAYADKLLADAKRVMSQGHPDTAETELAGIEAVGVQLEGDQSLPKADLDLLASGDWFQSNVMKILRRADSLEREDAYPAGKTVTVAALFLARTTQSLWRTGMQWDPSSVPDAPDEEGGGAWHLVPYHLSLSFDMVQLGWRPTLGPTHSMALGLPLSVSGRWGRLNPYNVAAHGGLSLVIRPASMWIPAIELSPLRVTIDDVDGVRQPRYGFEVAAYLVGGKLRVAIAADDYVLGQWWVPRERMRLTLGVADLNGLLFHLTR